MKVILLSCGFCSGLGWFGGYIGDGVDMKGYVGSLNIGVFFLVAFIGVR